MDVCEYIKILLICNLPATNQVSYLESDTNILTVKFLSAVKKQLLLIKCGTDKRFFKKNFKTPESKF